MASWRMYPKACWYAVAWSRQNKSEAEFFMRLMEGRVWALVDFEHRMSDRYVDCVYGPIQTDKNERMNVVSPSGLSL